MNDRVVSANISYESLQSIYEFQTKNKIRHFSDAVGEYIKHLEGGRKTLISRFVERLGIHE